MQPFLRYFHVTENIVERDKRIAEDERLKTMFRENGKKNISLEASHGIRNSKSCRNICSVANALVFFYLYLRILLFSCFFAWTKSLSFYFDVA